jgi:threonine/homoserine/homoserine lactone efflux protein
VTETVLAFALTSLIIELTPGPNMAWLALLSVERGRVAGLAAVAGVALGLLVLGLAATFGLGALIAENRWLYETLRWGGVAFLLYLAWDSYAESRKPLSLRGTNERPSTHFRRGLVTNLLNPKAALFYVTVLPNFVDASRPISAQSLTLTGIYVVIATGVHAAIALAGSLLQPLFSTDRSRRALGVAGAVLLALVAVWLAFTTRRAG